MKADWQHSDVAIELSSDDVESQSSFLNQEVNLVQLLHGGLRNTNYLVVTEHQSYVLRILEDDRIASIERFVYDTLDIDIPLPELYATETIKIDDSTYTWHWMEEIPGTTLARVADDLDLEAKQAIHSQAGEYLAAIGQIIFDKTGFLDSNFTVATDLTISPSSYPSIIDEFLTEQSISQLGDLVEPLREIVEAYSAVLGNIDHTPRLTHGDYNPENIMVAGEKISGILDWEYAISLHPYLDLGNFLRYKNDLDAAPVKTFISSYKNNGGVIDDNWQILVRLYDIIALLSFFESEITDQTKLNDIRERLGHYITELHKTSS